MSVECVKSGKKYRLRKDLVDGDYYGCLIWRNHNHKINGNVVTVEKIYDGYFTAKENGRPYTRVMLDEEILKEDKRENLKAGYVVEYRTGERELIQPHSVYGLVLVGEVNSSFCTELDIYLDSDLTNVNKYRSFDVVKVYGYSSDSRESMTTDIKTRKLLWEGNKKEKMTLSQVCKKLGRDIEIIQDEEYQEEE